MAGKRKATAAPASQPTKAKRTNVNRVDTSKDLKLSRSAETFQVYAGEEIAEEHVGDDGSVMVGLLYQYGLMNDWKNFQTLCNAVEAWYNDQRQYYSPDDLDRVCRAINFCWHDKRSICYVARGDSPGPGSVATSTTNILQKKQATIGKKLRDAFAVFDQSPFAQGNAPRSVKARVLLRIQTDYNELLRQTLYQHGVTPATVLSAEDLSVVSKNGHVHRTLRQQGISDHTELMEGLWWHDVGGGLWITDSFEAPQVTSASNGANTQVPIAPESAATDDSNAETQDGTQADASFEMGVQDEPTASTASLGTVESEVSTASAPNTTRSKARGRIIEVVASSEDSNTDDTPASTQELYELDRENSVPAGAEPSVNHNHSRGSSPPLREISILKTTKVSGSSAPKSVRFVDQQPATTSQTPSLPIAAARPKAYAPTMEILDTVVFPAELQPYLPSREDTIKTCKTKLFRGLHISDMIKNNVALHKEATNIANRMWNAAGYADSQNTTFKSAVSLIVGMLFLALFEKMQLGSSEMRQGGSTATPSTANAAPNASTEDKSPAPESVLEESSPGLNPPIEDGPSTPNGNQERELSAPSEDKGGAGTASMIDDLGQLSRSGSNASRESSAPDAVGAEDIDGAGSVPTMDVHPQHVGLKMITHGDCSASKDIVEEDAVDEGFYASQAVFEPNGEGEAGVSAQTAAQNQPLVGSDRMSYNSNGPVIETGSAPQGSGQEIEKDIDDAHEHHLPTISSPNDASEDCAADIEDEHQDHATPNASKEEYTSDVAGVSQDSSPQIFAPKQSSDDVESASTDLSSEIIDDIDDVREDSSPQMFAPDQRSRDVQSSPDAAEDATDESKEQESD